MERLTPGHSISGIPAGTWNKFVDTAKTVDQLVDRTNRPGSRGASALRVLIENTTGDPITADFPVLAFSAPVIKTTDRTNCVREAIQFVGTTPDDVTQHFGIVQGPIPENAFRPAIIEGPTWCRVDVTDESHTHARPTTTCNYLTSDVSGVPILWRELQDEDDSTGEQFAVVLLGGGSSSDYRVIRGQSYGPQSGSVIYLDAVQPLAGGLDPSGGNPAALVPVYNLFGVTYADNELVDAAYNFNVVADTANWETLKTQSGADRYRLISGRCVGEIGAADVTFPIDTIDVLAGGLDPRSDTEDPEEQVEITNGLKQNFVDREQVVAIWSEVLNTWEVLPVERYRSIRGTKYSGTNPIQIKNVEVLCSGLDPREDTTDDDEQVEVHIVNGDTYVTDDKVWADWNVRQGRWEARPKPGSDTLSYTAHITSPISAGTASSPASGSATIYEVAADGSTSSLGSQTLYNPYQMTALGDCACTKLADDKYLISGTPLLLTVTLTLASGVLTSKLFNQGVEISSSSVETVACGEGL